MEREYQKQKKEIDRQFYRQTKALKEELMEVDDNERIHGKKKRITKTTCNERREKSRKLHSQAIESSKEILIEMFGQIRDVYDMIIHYF